MPAILFLAAGTLDRSHHRLKKDSVRTGGLKQPRLLAIMRLRKSVCASSREQLSACTGKIGGIVCVKAGEAYHGALTQWTEQESLLWSYYSEANDAYTVKIIQAAVA